MLNNREKERKEADAMRKRLSELEQKQGLLVQKNLDGVINDVLLKQQLEYIEKEMFELESSLTTAVENE